MTATAPLRAGQRAAFAVPEDVAYFNTATLAPLLHSAREAAEAAVRRRATPWEITTADWFDDVERLRTLVGGLFGGDAEGVALVPATSYGLAIAARNLAGQIDARRGVLVLADEYPSGIYTWRSAVADRGSAIVTVARRPGQTWTDAVLDHLDERIAVVHVPTVHWTDGARVDIEAVGRRAREVDAALVVDASQSLGAVPLDVAAVRPDYVVSVGYKWLLGMLGRSYLWVAEQHRDGTPIEHNWIVRRGADDFAALVDYIDEYQPGARRFDQGSRTLFELTPPAIAALDQIHEWGVDRIAATLATITATLVERIGDLGLAPSTTGAERSPHIVGVPVPPEARDRVVAALARSGCHAAARGVSLRIAPHLHVTEEDVDRLVAALGSAL